MGIFVTAFILWIFWIAVGFACVSKIDNTGRFEKWLMDDPSGFLSHLIMTLWPLLLACIVYKSKILNKKSAVRLMSPKRVRSTK